MLFHSLPFLFAFLPLAWLGAQWCARAGGSRAVAGWLLLCSLAFYAYWRPDHLWILVASIAANFGFGRLILMSEGRARRLALAAGIGFDLLVLGWFKYKAFALAVAEHGWATLAGSYLNADLPIGISFFTFTQIAFLVDCHRRRVKSYGGVEYGLFVTIFPHLLAGPVIHHGQVVPQFHAFARRLAGQMYQARWLAPGLALLALGLIKKVVLADTLAPFADTAFALEAGERAGFLSAWGGALAYTLQIYFDFSGYSDMAIGIGLMLGVRLPANFLSPYRAVSVVEFWRRWHITLSHFLRDYLYIPLGGSRCGRLRRYANLMATMVLGGLWHGANWTFLAWGAIHGAALAANHLWNERVGLRLPRPLGQALTLLLVVLAWVPFRAPSMAVALEMWSAMAGLNGIVLPAGLVARLGGLAEVLSIGTGAIDRFGGGAQLAAIAVGAAVALFLPNSMTVLRRPGLLRGRAIPALLGMGLALALLLIHVRTASTFLYFQF